MIHYKDWNGLNFIKNNRKRKNVVKYRIKEKTEDELVYWYYPEGREDKHHGVVIVNLLTNDIVISELAEDDFEREISVEEHNRFIDSLNEMIKENGESDFVDYVTKPEKYDSMVVR